MRISRLTVDKLGVKLYDRVSAAIAEIVANCYDADAKKVIIRAPMGEFLSQKIEGKVTDRGFTIEVEDDGCGMTAEEVNEFYLIVGAERRADPKRGDRSKIYDRRVMGRKGVGKLAPFGICHKIEVMTAGGNLIKGQSATGKQMRGYRISHLILDRERILAPTDKVYNPIPGDLDETVCDHRGTIIRMSQFDHRKVPTMDEFERQLAQRFGLTTANWEMSLVDSNSGTGTAAPGSRTVGEFALAIKADTKIQFLRREGASEDSKVAGDYRVSMPTGSKEPAPQAGFYYEGQFYPITGWTGYAKQPYRDDLMAGVRIYCRGKIAAQTALFNLRAGFTGEYDVRSYLIGEIHADWLDEAEDLIRTDRQDILWSQDLGQAFQEWGQALVKLVGKITREPMRQSAWDLFEQKSDINNKLASIYPSKEYDSIRDNTVAIAKSIAKTARLDELEDPEHVESILQLSLLLGPHITLDEKLREAAEDKQAPLEVVNEILRTARIAELSSFGRIADDRVKVIESLETLKDTPGTLEAAFQKLLAEAPWLINAEWSPIIANRTFSTLRQEFRKFYKQKTGEELDLGEFILASKRTDFVLTSQDNVLQIVEIKPPDHIMINDDMDRLNNYVEAMREFLNDPANASFSEYYSSFHVTLVCNKERLSGVHKGAFEGLKSSGQLTHISWSVFLLRTKRTHEGFLKEAERQKSLAAKLQ